MEEVYIVAAQRTAIGKFGGALAPLTAAQLGAAAIKGALAASGLAAGKVDQVLMGNVIQAGGGQNPDPVWSGTGNCCRGDGKYVQRALPPATGTAGLPFR